MRTILLPVVLGLWAGLFSAGAQTNRVQSPSSPSIEQAGDSSVILSPQSLRELNAAVEQVEIREMGQSADGFVALPGSSLLEEEGKSYVFLQSYENPSRFDLVEVRIGTRYEDYVEVLEGVLPGDGVIIRGIVPAVEPPAPDPAPAVAMPEPAPLPVEEEPILVTPSPSVTPSPPVRETPRPGIPTFDPVPEPEMAVVEPPVITPPVVASVEPLPVEEEVAPPVRPPRPMPRIRSFEAVIPSEPVRPRVDPEQSRREIASTLPPLYFDEPEPEPRFDEPAFRPRSSRDAADSFFFPSREEEDRYAGEDERCPLDDDHAPMTERYQCPYELEYGRQDEFRRDERPLRVPRYRSF